MSYFFLYYYYCRVFPYQSLSTYYYRLLQTPMSFPTTTTHAVFTSAPTLPQPSPWPSSTSLLSAPSAVPVMPQRSSSSGPTFSSTAPTTCYSGRSTLPLSVLYSPTSRNFVRGVATRMTAMMMMMMMVMNWMKKSLNFLHSAPMWLT